MNKHFKILLSLLLILSLLAPMVPGEAADPSYGVSTAYSESVYCRNLRELTLTGDYRTDLVNVALTQVGYHEGANSRERDGSNLTSDGNWTEYGYFSACDGYAWCAMFISWCARQARFPASLLQNSTVARAYAFGLPFYLKEDYSPRTGDIIFFAEKGHVWDHVGIVMGVREGWVYTIEGNARNMVRIKRYRPEDEYIRGYGVYTQEDPQEDLVQRKRLYLLHYDLNGGEGKRTDQVALEGQILGIYPNEEDEPNPDSDQPPENAHWCWKEGCDFQGWYMRRDADRKWLTTAGWQDGKSIRENGCARRLFGDMDGFIMDGAWSEEDFGEFTLYAVWRNTLTGALEEESAYIYRADSRGWANPFRDLREDSRFYGAVKHLIQRGLLNGVEENRFGVNSTLTLAQLLALLYRSAGSPKVEEAELPYADVKPEAWYYEPVAWAWLMGCIPDSALLRPNARLSRTDFLHWLYTCAVGAGKTEPLREGDSALAQLRSRVSGQGLEDAGVDLKAVAWAQKIGALTAWGLTVPELFGSAGTTRLEACGILALFLERSGK